MAGITKDDLAPANTTGNNTHKSVSISDRSDQCAVHFHVDAVGATPTVTFKVQAAMESGDVDDASSHWFDIAMQPSDTAGASEVTNVTKTAIGVYTYYLQMAQRFFKKLRLVTSANTNVTYHAHVYARDVHQ